jgi:hypothetical protein
MICLISSNFKPTSKQRNTLLQKIKIKKQKKKNLFQLLQQLARRQGKGK